MSAMQPIILVIANGGHWEGQDSGRTRVGIPETEFARGIRLAQPTVDRYIRKH